MLRSSDLPSIKSLYLRKTAMNLTATIFISKKVINYPNIRKHISTSVVHPDLQRCSFLPTRPFSGRAKHPRRYLVSIVYRLLSRNHRCCGGVCRLGSVPCASVTRRGRVPGQLCFDYFHRIALKKWIYGNGVSPPL